MPQFAPPYSSPDRRRRELVLDASCFKGDSRRLSSGWDNWQFAQHSALGPVMGDARSTRAPLIMTKPQPTIDNSQEPVIGEAILARHIAELSAGVDRLWKSGMNRRAVVVLLRDITGLPMATIGRVLNAIPELAKSYLKTK